MSIQASRAVVRIAAVATVLACGWFVSYLVAAFYLDISRRPKFVLLVGLLSVLPTLFIWESVRAWRFLPKGIESLSIIWALAGVSGVFYGSILGFVDGWKIWSVAVIVIGFSIFLFGIWMTKQQKRLYDVA
jgi:hypothetical protein